MPTAHELLANSSITPDSACDREHNVITRLTAEFESAKLCDTLWNERQSIAILAAHHLGLDGAHSCAVLKQESWIRGGFNICIPVEVRCGSRIKKVLMRCPMPHKLAETRYGGTVEEKLRCEVGTYAWMQDHCPDIPIPHLYGFGFPDNQHFTHLIHRPFHNRLLRRLQRFLCTYFRQLVPSSYTRNPAPLTLHTGYLLLEFIEPSAGQMLSTSWQDHRQNPIQKQNLFRGMARVMLSLARVPQPKIGSFRFNNDGTVTLTNRPLFSSVAILENEGAPRVMQTQDTCSCTESFVSDMLTFHDKRFIAQPNAVFTEADCRGQMAVKTLLRTVAHHYLLREFRYGPYRVQHTDLHNSNIFVDADWNLKYLVDLEWVSSLPVEMLGVPYWLTGRGIDQIHGEHLDEFRHVRQQFMHIFHEEEIMRNGQISLTSIMERMWGSKGVWFWHCLDSVNGMYCLLEDHLCPAFSGDLSTEMEKIISLFWCEGSANIVAQKLDDKERYNRDLRRLFEEKAIADSPIALSEQILSL